MLGTDSYKLCSGGLVPSDFFIPLEVTSISKDTPRINEEIRAREVRVVSADND